jgi:hypothetical protein
MAAEQRYVVCRGRSLTTKRGLVGPDDVNPVVGVAELYGKTEDPTLVAKAVARLEDLRKRGYLRLEDEPNAVPEPPTPTRQPEAEIVAQPGSQRLQEQRRRQQPRRRGQTPQNLPPAGGLPSGQPSPPTPAPTGQAAQPAAPAAPAVPPAGAQPALATGDGGGEGGD